MIRKDADQYGQITTTDATQSTLASYAIDTDTSGIFVARVSAKNTATKRSAQTLLAFGAQNLAGTAAVLGTPTIVLSIANGSDAAMAAVLVAIDATGATVRIRVTGIVATNILWTATLERLGG
jgi:hypothetical protein